LHGGSEFMTTDGVAIRFACRGTGRRVYVCHGGPLGTYAALADDLAALEGEFTLVFHDYRGSGTSASAVVDTYDFSHLADDLDQLRGHLGDEQIDVLAHSMGVPVALHFALRHRASVRRMVLVGGSPISAKRMPWTMMRTLGPARLANLWLRGFVFVVRWSWRRAAPGRDRALLGLSRVTGESRREFRNSARGGPLSANDNTRRLQHEFLQVDITDQLAEIDRPSLVLYGDRDAVAVAGAPRFTRLQNVEFKVLPDVGHEVFADAPDLALRSVRTFLEGSDQTQ
jgi:pimeloyl-ACP methyl ester carboxylesterase